MIDILKVLILIPGMFLLGMLMLYIIVAIITTVFDWISNRINKR